MALLITGFICLCLLGGPPLIWWIKERPDKHKKAPYHKDKDIYTEEQLYMLFSDSDCEIEGPLPIDFSGGEKNLGCSSCKCYFDYDDGWGRTCRHVDNIRTAHYSTHSNKVAVTPASQLNKNRDCKNFSLLAGEERMRARREAKGFGHWFLG